MKKYIIILLIYILNAQNKFLEFPQFYDFSNKPIQEESENEFSYFKNLSNKKLLVIGEEEITLVGSDVSVWGDQSGNNNDMSASAGYRAIYNSSLKNGHGGLSFGLNDYYVGGATSTYKCMHDGTGGSMVMVAQKESNTVQLIWTTTGADNSGFEITINSTHIIYRISNGTGTYLLNSSQATDSEWYIIYLSYKNNGAGTDIKLKYNDSSIIKLQQTGSESSDGHLIPLRFCNNAQNLNGGIIFCQIFDKELTDNQINTLFDNLNEIYNIYR